MPYPEPVRIILQWIPQAQFAGYIMAYEKGFFRDEGVANIELFWTKRGETPLAALGQGKAEFATGWLGTGLRRRAQGYPIINIAQYHQRSASMIVGRKDAHLLTPVDLNDKILLSWGGDFGLEVELFLNHNGIIPRKILPLSDSLAPFINGLVPAMQAMEYNEYNKLKERGMKEEDMQCFYLADYGVNIAGDGLYTHEAFLREHRSIVRAVRNAVTRGWKYAFEHEEETLRYVLAYGEVQHVRTNASHQRNMLRGIRTLMEYRVGSDTARWGELRREEFDAAQTLLLQAEMLELPVHYENFYVLP